MPAEPLLEIRNLRKQYSPGIIALDDVNLMVPKASTLAVAGPSGAGKSTLARCIAGFEQPDTGSVIFHGGERTRIQMIFQDPGVSLNPRFTAWQIIEEPLLIRGSGRDERRRGALELMRCTGLAEAWADRKVGQFSGGQRARLAIARALAADPALLILDETLSSLDLSVRAQVVNLLNDLQKERGLAYLLITHDMALAAYFAGDTVMLHRGRIVSTCLSAILDGASETPSCC